MTPPKTRREIIEDACSIDPVAAYRYKDTGDAINLCASPVYTHFIDRDGSTVPLAFRDGRYGAGYARVSTLGQKEDGWSAADQVERITDHFLSRREAFRIFSDASLSGKLPTNDPDLIAKMHSASAQRYAEAYRAVFLSQPDLDPSERARREQWITEAQDRIRRGLKAWEVRVTPLDGEILLRGALKKHGGYRPALTEMMAQIRGGMIHSIALTDVSRLARSYSLTAQITEDLQHHRVQVVGLIEKLDWIGGEGGTLGDQITSSILTIIAEYKLREICTSVVRGIAKMLKEGSPHGQLPHWIRKEDGVPVLIPEKAETIRRVVAFALENETMGWHALTRRLNDDPERFPPPHHETRGRNVGYWRGVYVKKMLALPHLCGMQEAFGIRWKTLPEVIDVETFDRLQRRSTGRPKREVVIREGIHLLTYLLRCGCGMTMRWTHAGIRARGSEYTYYTCNCLVQDRARVTDHDRHARLPLPQVEAFFSELIVFHADALLRLQDATPERELLQGELDRLREERDALETGEAAVLESCRERARTQIRGLLRQEPTQAMIDSFVSADPEYTALSMTLEKLGEDIESVRRVMGTLLPSDYLGTMTERIERWESLSTDERNQLLRKLIARVDCVVEENGWITMTIHPNTSRGGRLLPVRIAVTRKGKGWARSIPTVSEWIDSWAESALRMNEAP